MKNDEIVKKEESSDNDSIKNRYTRVASDVLLHDHSIEIKTGLKWYARIWVLISNPFRYLFKGILRY